MAVDEVLLEDADQGIATLRCYGWSEPTLSLGYFQHAADRANHLASVGCPLVRRASGGGAILHDAELTYSFAAPVADRLGASAAGLYQAIHGALAETLAARGIIAHCWGGPADGAPAFLCFQRRAVGDLVVGANKIAGSAQRRHRRAILQHGSVLLNTSRCAPELPGLQESTGRQLHPAELAEQFRSILAAQLGLRWITVPDPNALSPRAEAVARSKFGAPDWTFRR
jgi:lipoate-protein ligase A